VGVEKTLAGRAPKAGPRDQGVGVREDVSLHEFFLAGAATPLAAKLSVEGFKGAMFRCQLVAVSFDSLQGQLGVHRLEVHPQTLRHQV